MQTPMVETLSALVQNQLPEFVQENYQTFTAFLKAYYEFIEQDGNVQYVIQNARSYKDIDDTIDAFVDNFLNEFAYDLPGVVFKDQDVFMDNFMDNFVDIDEFESKKALAKKIGTAYQAKGSEAAIRLLFRLLFNDEIGFFYPGNVILRASDNNWIENQSIKVYEPTGNANVFSFAANLITGQTSGATAVIDTVTLLGNILAGKTVYELKLDKNSLNGSFRGNEILMFETSNVILRPLNVIQSIDILDAGYGYSVGTGVSIVGSGVGFSAQTRGVNDGGKILSFTTDNFGAGYDSVSSLSIPLPDITRSGKYELYGNIITMVFDENHGLVDDDLINVRFTTGNISTYNGLHRVLEAPSVRKIRISVANENSGNGTISRLWEPFDTWSGAGGTGSATGLSAWFDANAASTVTNTVNDTNNRILMASWRDRTGNITANVDNPYSPGTLTDLPMYGTGTNLTFNSERMDLKDAFFAGTKVLNAINGPNIGGVWGNTLTADLLKATSSTTNLSLAQTDDGRASAYVGSPLTFSVYVKSAHVNAEKIGMVIYLPNSGVTFGQKFNLVSTSTEGVYSHPSLGTAIEPLNKTITDVGGGWSRIGISWNIPGGDISYIVYLFFINTSGGVDSNTVPTDHGYYVWGMQSNPGTTPGIYQKNAGILNPEIQPNTKSTIQLSTNQFDSNGGQFLLDKTIHLNRNMTIYMVFKRETSPIRNTVIGLLNDAGTLLSFYWDNSGSPTLWSYMNSSVSGESFGINSSVGYFMAGTQMDATELKLWLNGSQFGTTKTSPADPTGQQFTRIAGAFSGGSYCELLVWRESLNTSDRQKVEGYLAHKWGLTSGLPVSHPYKTSPPMT